MPSLKAALSLDETPSPAAVTRKNWVPPKPSYCSPKPSAGPTLIIKSAYSAGLFDDDDDEDEDEVDILSDDEQDTRSDHLSDHHPYLGSYDAVLPQHRRRSSDKSIASPMRSLAKASKILGTDLSTTEHLSQVAAAGRLTGGIRPKARFDSGSGTSQRSAPISIDRLLDSPSQRSSNESQASARQAVLPTTPERMAPLPYDRSVFDEWEDRKIAPPSAEITTPYRFWSRASRTFSSSNTISPAQQSPVNPLRRTPRRPPASDIITTRPPFYKSPSSQTDITASSPDSAVEILANSDDEGGVSPTDNRSFDSGRESEIIDSTQRSRGSISSLEPAPSSSGQRRSTQPEAVSTFPLPSHEYDFMRRSPSDTGSILHNVGQNSQPRRTSSTSHPAVSSSNSGRPGLAEYTILSFDPNRRPRAPFPVSQLAPHAVHNVSNSATVSPLSGQKVLAEDDALSPCPDRMLGIQRLMNPRKIAQQQQPIQCSPQRPWRPTDGDIFEGLHDSPLHASFDEQPTLPARRSSRVHSPRSTRSRERPARRAPPKGAPPALPIPVHPVLEVSTDQTSVKEEPCSPSNDDKLLGNEVCHGEGEFADLKSTDATRMGLPSPVKAEAIMDASSMQRASPGQNEEALDGASDQRSRDDMLITRRVSDITASRSFAVTKVDRQHLAAGAAQDHGIILSVGGLQFASTYQTLASERLGLSLGNLARWLTEVVKGLEGDERRFEATRETDSGAIGAIRANTRARPERLTLAAIPKHLAVDEEMSLPDSPTIDRGPWQGMQSSRRPSAPRAESLHVMTANAPTKQGVSSSQRAVSMAPSEDDSTFDEAFGNVVVRRDSDAAVLLLNDAVSLGASPQGGLLGDSSLLTFDKVNALHTASQDHRRSSSATVAVFETGQWRDPWHAATKTVLKEEDLPTHILPLHRRLSVDSAQVPRSVKSQSQSNVSSIYDGSEDWADETDSLRFEESNDAQKREYEEAEGAATTDSATTADEQTPTALATHFKVSHAPSALLRLHIRIEGRNPLCYPTILHVLEHGSLPDYLLRDNYAKGDLSDLPSRQATLRAVQRESAWLGYDSVASLCQAELNGEY